MEHSSPVEPAAVAVCEAPDDNVVGDIIGQCKWFNDKLGYGFVTVQSGQDKGKDIFVHHSGVKPLNSNYKTLKKGEYINFHIVNGDNGLQAVNVTGIGGGTLMCDIIPMLKVQQPPVDPGFTIVDYGNIGYNGGGAGGVGYGNIGGGYGGHHVHPGQGYGQYGGYAGGRGDGSGGGRGRGGGGRGRGQSNRMYQPTPPGIGMTGSN